MVIPPSKFYTASNVLFHKYEGDNAVVKNCMSHFSMFFPTKVTVKLANGKTGHAQVIGIIYVAFLTVKLYIQLEQFIIEQVTLPILSHQVTSNLCWFLKGYI